MKANSVDFMRKIVLRHYFKVYSSLLCPTFFLCIKESIGLPDCPHRDPYQKGRGQGMKKQATRVKNKVYEDPFSCLCSIHFLQCQPTLNKIYNIIKKWGN